MRPRKNPMGSIALILYPTTGELAHLVTLMKNDIMFAPGKFARWEGIERLWYLESRGQLRLAPKLTAIRI